MERISGKNVLRTVVAVGIFMVGYLCGSLTRHDANAQWGQVGSDVLKSVEKGGGPLGTVAQLGSTISDMEKNISGLQKNVDVLKKVKAALGGR